MERHDMSDPLSRRRFFRASGATAIGGSAVLIAACGDDQTGGAGIGGGRARAEGSEEADIEILNSALDLEHMAVAAYKAGASKLRGSVLDVAQQFLEQEQEHAQGLVAAIKDMGGTANRAKSSYDFPELSGEQAVLRFAMRIENTAVAAYIDALPKLSDAELRATAASIVTNEAEHIAVLRGALGLNRVPDAFVRGVAS